MDKLDQKVVGLWTRIKKFCTIHKTISIVIGVILLVLIVGSCGHHRKFGPGRGFGLQMMRGGKLGGEMGGKGGPGMMSPGGGNRLFDKFCDEDGSIKDQTGFKDKFMMGANKRFDKMNPMKDHLQNVIDELKKKSYDTTNLENKLKQIDELVAQFQSGTQNFQASPQDFCRQQSGRVELNNQIKSIMTGIMEEIKKAEGK